MATIYWIHRAMAESKTVGPYQAWPAGWMKDNPAERAAIAAQMLANGWEQTDRETYIKFSRSAYQRSHRAERARW